ncbi:MAG: hypothetical protein ACK4KW_06800 [Gemmobacter sp.]
MPNTLSYLVLLGWPLVVLVLFRRMPAERALIWSILGGYLLLPPVAQIDLPMIPAFDKMSIPALSAFLVCTLVLGHRIGLLPATWPGRILLGLFLAAPLGTALTNAEPVVMAPQVVLPGLTLYDAFSVISRQIYIVLTWSLARHYLGSSDSLREILRALVIGGLAYSLPMLLEVRLSPQLNTWIYGFFQHSFEQMMRGGGFRPIVFLEHGLWVAFFAMTAFIAALALARESAGEARMRLILASAYLAVVLVLCKSMGSVVYAAVLAPVVLAAGVNSMLRLSVLLALVALAYPLLRAAGHVPVAAMVELAASVDAERAHSLNFRFENEAMLLMRALERPLFGWGGYLRSFVFDPVTGQVATISDGRWVIVLGMFGWAGYAGEFGLLALPIFMLWRRSRDKAGSAIGFAAGTLALVHGVNMVDLLPNATITPFTWLIAGALTGHAECRRSQPAAQQAPSGQPPPRPTPRTVI